MIRIFKDNDVKVVTQGVYKNLYAPLGYKPVIDAPQTKVVVNRTKTETKAVKTKKTKQTKESSEDNSEKGE